MYGKLTTVEKNEDGRISTHVDRVRILRAVKNLYVVKMETGPQKGQCLSVLKTKVEIVKSSSRNEELLTVAQFIAIDDKYQAMAKQYGKQFMNALRIQGFNMYEIATMSGNNLNIYWEQYQQDMLAYDAIENTPIDWDLELSYDEEERILNEKNFF